MAYVRVNHQKMLTVATQIEDYIKKLDNNMKSIDNAVSSLKSEWMGKDYLQVKKEWEEINSKSSTTDKMRSSLNAYASSIRETAKIYKEAQARAINRANTLCK